MLKRDSIQREYLYYMNMYRGYTILCIVFVHSLTRFLDHSLWYYDYLLQFFGESTCIFLFISGFLYEFLGYDEVSYVEFLRKKLRRLIVPYLFWIVPCLILKTIIQWESLNFYTIIWILISGLSIYNGALWYIQLIFSIFIIAPLIHYLFRERLLVWVITLCGILLSLITSRDNPNHCYYGIATIPHMIGFFLLGMTAAKYRDILKYMKAYVAIMIIVIGVILCLIQGYMKFPLPDTTLISLSNIDEGITLNWLTFNKLFFSIGLFAMFYIISQRIKQNKVLDFLAKYSFPIFFSHLYFYLPWTLIGSDSHGGLFNFLLYGTYIIIGSSVLCYTLGKIKYINKLIGI